MTIQDYQKLEIPDSPGVYYFKEGETVLYIGRATSLADRTRSYFAKDLIATRGPHFVDMVTRTTELSWVQADSVLDAIVLEANAIKTYSPYYNTKEKDDTSFDYVVITDEVFPRIVLVREKDLENGDFTLPRKYSFGPFVHGPAIREGLKIIRKIFPYRDRCEVPDATKQTKPKKCFNAQIGLCPGVCVGAITKEVYAQNIRHIVLFFQGKKGELIQDLTREMNAYAKELHFEEAHEIKKTIFALTHIRDSMLIRSESEVKRTLTPSAPAARLRIEAYDIAHTAGRGTVGVMTVIEDGVVSKNQYRMFKIKSGKGNDDIANTREIVSRRLEHPEWPFPNCIVVDGGEPQRSSILKLLAETHFDIEVVAVTKNDKHKPEKLLGNQEFIKVYEKEIVLVNSEAHRFAVKYHRKTRANTFLTPRAKRS
jgi:excinuclease ABC subunit C